MNFKIIPVEDAILGIYKNNSVQSAELSTNGGVIANYVEKSPKNNDIAQIGNIKLILAETMLYPLKIVHTAEQYQIFTQNQKKIIKMLLLIQ